MNVYISGCLLLPRSQGRRSAVGGHALSDASVNGGARREGGRERTEPPVGEEEGGGEGKKERPLARLVVASASANAVAFAEEEAKKGEAKEWSGKWLPSFLPSSLSDRPHHTTPAPSVPPPPSVGGLRRDTEACLTSRVI